MMLGKIFNRKMLNYQSDLCIISGLPTLSRKKKMLNEHAMELQMHRYFKDLYRTRVELITFINAIIIYKKDIHLYIIALASKSFFFF